MPNMNGVEVSDTAFDSHRIDQAEREADAEAEGKNEYAAPDLTNLPPAYTNQGRHLRKKFQLQKKLQAKREAQRLKDGESEQEKEEAAAAEVERAKVAAEKLKEIEKNLEEENKPKEPKKQIKVGGKMLMTTEADMTPKESAKLQALVGAGKGSKMRAVFKEEGEKKTFDDSELKVDEIIIFSGCRNCEYTITTTCTKVFVEDCHDFLLRVDGKIITQTIEVDNCERTNILVGTKIGTLQIERCKKINVTVADKKCFHDGDHTGYMIWAGCFMLRVQVGEQHKCCDFGLTQKLDKSIHIERTQFKIWINKLGRLTCDKVIRLKNGFPSTKREDDEHLRREEGKLEDLAKRVGVNVHRKETAVGSRVKPNAKCPCGSGLKFKKCCRDGEAQDTAAVTKAQGEKIEQAPTCSDCSSPTNAKQQQ